MIPLSANSFRYSPRGRSPLYLALALLGIVLVISLAWIASAPACLGAAEEPAKGVKSAGTHATGAAGHDKAPSAMEHVTDAEDWHFFQTFGPPWLREIHLPKPITKFMILELLAAGLIVVIYVPLSRRVSTGEPVQGWKDNAFEVLLTFVRNDIARPSIGEHDADKYVPFLWTLFLFILFNNLLGMFPFAGSATASIYVTAGLAVCVFFAIHGSAIAKMGFGHYLESLWPHIDVPFGLGPPLKLMIFIIEWMGVLVRNGVLAVRLFANMFAGHMVLATILIFIYAAKGLYVTSPALWGTITLASVVGQVLLSLLEIFVAFLQAYIFVFLAALFMGMAMHPQH